MSHQLPYAFIMLQSCVLYKKFPRQTSYYLDYYYVCIHLDNIIHILIILFLTKSYRYLLNIQTVRKVFCFREVGNRIPKEKGDAD